ncbi:hypothetical protein H6G97_45965 [Nostoc flagelliforme FACHB-838]|uniref:Transposase n=1 Tax=Nostoc flagelliforme FACHB-838 TaxID=2692904 RepID=A0ABR8E3N6_9NOSO|nr:hypothetical protein [Nostoc flagelliforme FACHB-838]
MVHATLNQGCQYLERVPKNVFPVDKVLDDGSYLSWIAPDRKSKYKGGSRIQVRIREYTIDSENGQQTTNLSFNHQFDGYCAISSFVVGHRVSLALGN